MEWIFQPMIGIFKYPIIFNKARWLLLLIVGLYSIQSGAQSLAMDSVLIHSGSAEKDTAHVHFLCGLSTKFLTYRPVLSRQYALEALLLSQKMKYRKGEMMALNRLGEYEFRQSNYARAVEHLTRALRHAEELHDSIAMAGVYRVLGNVNTFGFKQYDKALRYQQQALSISKNKSDMRNIASLYGNITWIYAITNQHLEEAHHLARRGLKIADSLRIDQLLGYNYNSQGLIFMQEGLLDSALFYLEKSNEIGMRIMDFGLNAYNNSIKGNIYLQKKDFNKAREMFSLAELESRKLNSREVLKESYNGLARTYEGLGNFPLAYQYHKMYTDLKDSLINWEITQKALMMEHELDEQRRVVKITELQQLAERERSMKKIYALLLLVGISSLLIILALIIRINRQRTRTNELLLEKNNAIENQNLQLKQANEIKDKLFFIIGHDLRGPLSNLKALLSLVVRNQVSDQEFKTLTPQLNQSVVSINETIENLLQWSGSQLHGWQQHAIEFPAADVIDKAFHLFADSAASKSILLINQVARDLRAHADRNQIELVFRNLIHNAIKFTPEGGSIIASASISKEFIHVDITDSGVGMSEMQLATLFDEHNIRNTQGTKGEKGTGLGLTLCREMINANGGKIHVTSKQHEGTTVHVTIPKGKQIEDRIESEIEAINKYE
jgi:signal transduction histidine kinase